MYYFLDQIGQPEVRLFVYPFVCEHEHDTQKTQRARDIKFAK